jgi:hypothetical protein
MRGVGLSVNILQSLFNDSGCMFLKQRRYGADANGYIDLIMLLHLFCNFKRIHLTAFFPVSFHFLADK